MQNVSSVPNIPQKCDILNIFKTLFLTEHSQREKDEDIMIRIEENRGLLCHRVYRQSNKDLDLTLNFDMVDMVNIVVPNLSVVT